MKVYLLFKVQNEHEVLEGAFATKDLAIEWVSRGGKEKVLTSCIYTEVVVFNGNNMFRYRIREEVLMESKMEDHIKRMVDRIKEWEPENQTQMRKIMLDRGWIEKIQATIQEIKDLRDL